MHLFRMTIRCQRNRVGIQIGICREISKALLLCLPFLIVGIGGDDASRHLRMGLADVHDAGRIVKGK